MNRMLRNQRGMTLTETLMVLAVSAMVSVLAYGGYRAASGDVETNSMITSTTQLVSNVKKLWGPVSVYDGLDNANVIKAGLVPQDFKVDTTNNKIYAFWGSEVTIAVDDTDATLFNLKATNVPKEICTTYISGLQGLALKIDVAGTVVKDLQANPVVDYTVSGVAGACGAALSSDVTFTIR